MMRTKSDILIDHAKKSLPVKQIRLIGCGPEFEVVQPPAPTYEQAIVSMYLEAKKIVQQGRNLKEDVKVERELYLYQSRALRLRRNMLVKPAASPVEAFLLKQSEKRVLEALDRVWVAQERYKTWVDTQGDVL